MAVGMLVKHRAWKNLFNLCVTFSYTGRRITPGKNAGETGSIVYLCLLHSGDIKFGRKRNCVYSAWAAAWCNQPQPGDVSGGFCISMIVRNNEKTNLLLCVFISSELSCMLACMWDFNWYIELLSSHTFLDVLDADVHWDTEWIHHCNCWSTMVFTIVLCC